MAISYLIKNMKYIMNMWVITSTTTHSGLDEKTLDEALMLQYIPL